MTKVYLRALALGDVDNTFRWHNDAGLYEHLVSPYRHVSRLSEEEWLRKKMAYSNAEMQFAICLAENDRHIGNIHLRGIDWVSRFAETGVFIGEPEFWSKGCGSEAMMLLLRHAYRDLNLRRIWLTVFADNQRAVRSYEKCGFVTEGRLRKHAYKNGEYKDLFLMAVNIDELPEGQV